MAGLAPLAMSQTKDELLGYLNMGTETYTMMAKEADRYYQWLITDKYHFKENCRRNPPYDWSDINEKSKDEAMKLISKSGDTQTSYYWNLAGPSPDECPNWIARWFLYHKFRYRDGRNRNLPSNGGSGKGPSQHSSHHQHSASASSSASSAYYGTQTHGSMTSESSSSSYENDYGSYDTRTSSYTQGQQVYEQDDGQHTKSYYDPVRDVER